MKVGGRTAPKIPISHPHRKTLIFIDHHHKAEPPKSHEMTMCGNNTNWCSDKGVALAVDCHAWIPPTAICVACGSSGETTTVGTLIPQACVTRGTAVSHRLRWGVESSTIRSLPANAGRGAPAVTSARRNMADGGAEGQREKRCTTSYEGQAP